MPEAEIKWIIEAGANADSHDVASDATSNPVFGIGGDGSLSIG